MITIQLWRVKREKELLGTFKSHEENLFSVLLPPNCKYGFLKEIVKRTCADKTPKIRPKPFLKFLKKAVHDPTIYQICPNGLCLFWGEVKGQYHASILPTTNNIQVPSFETGYKFKFELLDDHATPKIKTFTVVHLGVTKFTISDLSNDTKIIKTISVDFSFADQKNNPPTFQMVKEDEEKMHKYLKEVKMFLRGKHPIIVGANDNILGLAAVDKFLKVPSTEIVTLEANMDYGEAFKEILKLSIDKLKDCIFVQKSKALESLFQVMDNKNLNASYLLNLDDIIEAIECKSLEIVYIWEDLKHRRLTIAEKPPKAGQHDIYISHGSHEPFYNSASNWISSEEPLIRWLADNYQNLGIKLEIVTNDTEKVDTFLRRTRGLAGVLKMYEC